MRTPQKKKAVLKKSEQIFRSIFDNAVDGIVLADIESKKFSIGNKAFSQMLGYSQEEIKNLGVMDIHPEESLPYLTEQFERQSRKEISLAKNTPVKRKDGSVFYADINTFTMTLAGKTHLAGIFRDVTDRKLAEDETKLLKRQLEFILGSTKTGLDIIDAEFNIRYVDPQWALLYGDYHGRKCYEYFAGVNSVCPTCGVPQALKTKKPFVAEQILPKENNRPIQVVSVPFQDENGEWLLAEVNVDITERKRAEDALRKSEEMVRAILDATTESVLLLDTKGTILAINETAARRFGKSTEEIIGLNARDVGPSLAPQVLVESRLEHIRSVICSGRSLRFEDQREDIIFDTSIYPVFDADGKVSRVAIFGRDITERKRTEDALRESEERVRAILDATTESVLLLDTKGTILAINKTGAQRFGKKVEELVGFNMRDSTPDMASPAVVKSRIEHIDKVARSGKPVRFEDRRGGIILDSNMFPIFDEKGQVTRLAIFARDITRQKKMEDALKESEEKYRTLVENASDQIFMIDKEYKLVSSNKTALMLFGKKPNEVIGRHISEIFPKEIAAKNIKNLKKVLKTGTPVSVEEKLIVGKHEFWSSSILNPVKNDAGKTVAIIGVVRDITEKKKTEETLQELKHRYQTLFKSAPVGIGVASQDNRILECNNAMLKMMGCSEDEIKQINLRDVYQDPQRRQEMLKQLERDGIVQGFEVQLKRKDGTPYWATLTIIPFTFEGQKVRLTVQEDITERKKAEETLKIKDSAIASSINGIAIANWDGKLTYVNDSFLRMWKYEDASDVLGKSAVEFWKNRDEVAKTIEAVRDGKSWIGELTAVREDGSTFDAQVSAGAVLDRAGNPICMMASFMDITEHKLAAEILEKSESKYRTLLENLPQRIFLKDTSSVYVSCNDNYARDMKIKPEEIAGKTDYDFYPKKLAEKYRADDKRIMEGGKTEDMEEKYVRGGQELIVRTVKTPVKDAKGKVSGILGIFRDITREKRAQEELQKYHEKMIHAEQLASLGALGATLVHELAQPLTVITLSIENALTKLKTMSCPRTVTKKLKDSIAEVSSITSIITRFRNYAKKSSEGIAEDVDLKPIAERTVRLLSESARKAKVTLRLKGLDKLPSVYSSEKDMEQLFFALVENAIEAADGKKDRRVIISGTVDGGYVQLRFADNCGGISAENLDKIFEPFFTTKPAHERTGLGLCIVEHVVSRAGGKVRVESKAGKGSTFFVTLPINVGKK